MPPLVRLLRVGSEKGVLFAAYTLSALTSTEASFEEMRAHDAVPALVAVLTDCPNVIAKKGAMRAIGRLARSDACVAQIVERGGLPAILTLLVSEEASLVR